GCPTEGTSCQCPTCVGNSSLDSNTCRAPGTTDQCTMCGDGVIQLTSSETCDGSAFSGVCHSDTTKRCTAGSTTGCVGPCTPVCSNSDPANPPPCPPPTAAIDCHDALATCNIIVGSCLNGSGMPIACTPPDLHNCAPGDTCDNLNPNRRR